MVEAELVEIKIVQQRGGRLVCQGEPPSFALFSRQIVEMLRRNGCLWASIEGDAITMRVYPQPLYYRLTGEAVEVGADRALVAQRMTEDGRVW